MADTRSEQRQAAVRAGAAPPPAAPSGDKIFPVSWDQFHRESRALAWRLSGVGPVDHPAHGAFTQVRYEGLHFRQFWHNNDSA